MVLEENPSLKKQQLAPKALIHQKYGSQACYKIEEVEQFLDNGCPGLVIQKQAQCLYRCTLNLPGLTVTSDTFTRKKDAENGAAKIAIDRLGIHQAVPDSLSREEAWNELVARLSSLFRDEFILTANPLVSHIRVAMRKLSGIPISAILACDTKINNLCKAINPKAELDPIFSASLVMKAAKLSQSILTYQGELSLSKRIPYSPEALPSLLKCNAASSGSMEIKAVWIPYLIDKDVELVTFNFSDKEYYMDEIAKKLGVRESSLVFVSRNVSKASSQMKLYSAALDAQAIALDSSVDILSDFEEPIHLISKLNKRASLLCGQNLFGDAILANVGYTWKSPDLFFENVSLCAYYRILLSKMPDGHYKLSRNAIFAAKLPEVFTSSSNWSGPYPRDLLSYFCRQHRLAEPVFVVKDELQRSNEHTKCDGKPEKLKAFSCEVKLLSRRSEPIIDCSHGSYTKEGDAIQGAALKVLNWLNKYFKHRETANDPKITFYPENLSCAFSDCISIISVKNGFLSKSNSSDLMSMDEPNGRHGMNVEGSKSGGFTSPGCLTRISYSVALVGNDSIRINLENNEEFEFEIGTGSVVNQIEEGVAELSVCQTAKLITELKLRGLILAAVADESVSHLLQLPLDNCFLEYSIKLLHVTEPLEDRMEKALFNPPLSKQRVEFAVQQINESNAITLVDFGCGSGSLLEALLENTTTLQKIVGVDVSLKGLTHAAKKLRTKLSMNASQLMGIRSAVLYDGSITEYDSRLNGADIATCLEVIEHMEEDQASAFGDITLSLHCPQTLIVSTPNYEYNPILQKSVLGKSTDPEEKSEPCRFRVHDHRFEWTRKQFENWATDLALRHFYSVEFSGVGGSGDVEPGFATQIAVFRRREPQHPEKRRKLEESSQTYKVIWEWSKEGV